MTQARIAGLFVYPLKSGAGIALDAAELGACGLAHDRRWLVATPEGRFLTQRELPRLALLRPRLTGHGLQLALGEADQLDLPPAATGAPMTVRVWRDQVAARTHDAAADAALTRFLGRPVRLVGFDETQRRPCDPAYAPPDAHTAFADGFPLLVTSEGSLRALNEALLERGEVLVPMARFRPNLVLADVPAGAEDDCRSLDLGQGVRLDLVKPCDRCVITTIDQASGERRGPEPLATLRRLRRNPRTGGAWFGQNAVPRLDGAGVARLRVGDPCRLVAG